MQLFPRKVLMFIYLFDYHHIQNYNLTCDLKTNIHSSRESLCEELDQFGALFHVRPRINCNLCCLKIFTLHFKGHCSHYKRYYQEVHGESKNASILNRLRIHPPNFLTAKQSDSFGSTFPQPQNRCIILRFPKYFLKE